MDSNGVFRMTSNCVVNGCEVLGSNNRAKCESCVEAKLARAVITKTSTIPDNISVLEIVHSEVCGLIKPVSKGEANYFVNFIDQMCR